MLTRKIYDEMKQEFINIVEKHHNQLTWDELLLLTVNFVSVVIQCHSQKTNQPKYELIEKCMDMLEDIEYSVSLEELK